MIGRDERGKSRGDCERELQRGLHRELEKGDY